jgi:hypothetical protein
MKKGIWLLIFTRGLLLAIILNWTIFLIIDGVLTSSHMIVEKFIYRYDFFALIFYLLSLYPEFGRKFFQIKDKLNAKQIQYLLARSSLWCLIFSTILVLSYVWGSEELLVNLKLFSPFPLFMLFSLVMTYKLQKFN